MDSHHHGARMCVDRIICFEFKTRRFKLEFITTHQCSYNDQQFHIGDITAN